MAWTCVDQVPSIYIGFPPFTCVPSLRVASFSSHVTGCSRLSVTRIFVCIHTYTVCSRLSVSQFYMWAFPLGDCSSYRWRSGPGALFVFTRSCVPPLRVAPFISHVAMYSMLSVTQFFVCIGARTRGNQLSPSLVSGWVDCTPRGRAPCFT